MFLVPFANPATTTTLTGLSAKKRLTLVTKDSGLVSQLQSLIQEIPDSPYHLESCLPENSPLLRFPCLEMQDLYLLDAECLFASPIATHWQNSLTTFGKRVAPIPVILVTTTAAFGLQALNLGITDFWAKDELSLSLIRRSLRLIFRSLTSAPLPPLISPTVAFYQSLMDGIPHSLFCKDLRGRFIYANPAFLNTLGLSLAECLGKTVYDLYPADLAAKYDSDDQWLLRTDRKINQVQSYFVSACQEMIQVHVIKQPLKNAEGKLIGTQGMFWNITNSQQTQDHLQLLQNLISTIITAPTFESALELTLHQVCEMTGWHYGEAWLPHSSHQHLRLSQSKFFSHSDLLRFYHASESITFELNQGLPGRVWASQKPEWIGDVSAESTSIFLRRDLAKSLKLKGALGVPILVQDQVIAVLVFFTTQVRETDPHLVKVVSAVAQQLGLVLERKQIEVALRQQKELLENLVDQRSGNLGSIQAP